MRAYEFYIDVITKFGEAIVISKDGDTLKIFGKNAYFMENYFKHSYFNAAKDKNWRCPIVLPVTKIAADNATLQNRL